METPTTPQPSNRKGLVTGLIIISIGVFWLLNRMGVYLPNWLFDWPMILIYIGTFIGISHRFKNPVAWILIAIGAFGLVYEFLDIPIEMRRYIWPLALIVIGLIVIIRPKGGPNRFRRDKNNVADNGSRVNTVSVFNGSKRYVTSKNFIGGETVSIFGGTEINLLNADFDGTITLDNTVIFGGLKLIVPQNWEVNLNATAIFGGVEDKRLSAVEIVSDDDKVLRVTGTVVFGGIDVVSY